MLTKRSDKLVCSEHCQNQMSYIHRRDFSSLTKPEFVQKIGVWIEAGIHPNPNHPISKLDAALAAFYESITNAIKQNEEIN